MLLQNLKYIPNPSFLFYRPTALKLSLNVFKALKSDDFMEDVIAICQEEENMLDLIQSIGRQIPIQNLPKITEALKNRYPNLLTQLVKIVLERADAAVVEGFTIEQPHLFDLVCDFGSEEDGRALMKRIFQSQNLPQDKLSHLMLRLKVCTLYICTGPSLDPPPRPTKLNL